MKKPKETKATEATPEPATTAPEPVMFSNEQVDRDPSLIVGMVEVAHSGTHKWYRPE